MDIELGQYTKIEFYDASHWCNGDTPLWVLRVKGTGWARVEYPEDRKSTRLNSSHRT